MKFKGNNRQVSILKSWLTSYLNNENAEKYQILISDYNGNGLTMLCKQLAEEFNLEFTEITSLDITSKTDLTKIQGLLLSMSLNQKKRLIVFDEITEIKYKKDIFKLTEISKNPILFTTTSLFKLAKKYRKNVIRIYKPSITDMIEILKEKAKEYGVEISNSELLEIIYASPSVATAISALFSRFPSEMVGTTSYYSLYYNFLKNRRVAVDSLFLYWLVENTETIVDKSFLKIVSNLLALTQNGREMEIRNDIIKNSVKFRQQPSYPLYFQYKANSLQRVTNISVFLSKIGSVLHLSKREVLNDILPILKEVANDNKWLLSQIKELGLSKEEIRMIGIKYIKKETKNDLEKVKHKKEIRLDGYF